MAHVIGYTDWKDFLREAKLFKPDVIRVQAYYYTVATSPLPMLEFVVNASFADGPDLHVFKVGLGTVWETDLERDDVQERFRRRMEKAEALITQALREHGFAVRRGIFTAAKECRVKGWPNGLWKWEGKGPEAEIVPVPSAA